jgi:hypothetical protein
MTPDEAKKVRQTLCKAQDIAKQSGVWALRVHIGEALAELERITKNELCPSCHNYLRSWNDHAADCKER